MNVNYELKLLPASADGAGRVWFMGDGGNRQLKRREIQIPLGDAHVADKDAAQFEFGYSSQSINDDCLVTAGAGVGAQAIELSDAQSAAIDGYTGPFEASLASASVVPGL